MTAITFIEHDGTEHHVDAASGVSVMEAAIQNDIVGIEAECGGALACATCHVYVDAMWLDKLPQRSTAESDMLECAASECLDNSRLSCQIKISPALDGLVVKLPESQS